jgi:ketosteroid isomerase-like protein
MVLANPKSDGSRLGRFVHSLNMRKELDMSKENEQIVRTAYQRAEEKDLDEFMNCFTPDGAFTDNSINVTYKGQDIAFTVDNFGKAFPDMHRELYRMYSTDNMVMVQLALQGTHEGDLHLPFGVIPATGNRMDAPCADFFEIVDGKIQRFDCYPSGTILLTQLGVLDNLSAHIQH